MGREEQVDVASLFEDIRTAVPSLRMEMRREHPQVDLLMEVPSQPGLPFPVTMNVQGDELHLCAGALWVEWFPSSDPQKIAAFREAAIGVLSGRYRILESTVGRHVASARLQSPAGGGWKTVAWWSGPWALVPWPRRTRVLKNEAARG